MGFGLPSAIGACFANKKQRVCVIVGDGGLQMSLMELQTVVHHQLPITIFMLENDGYLSIRMTQKNHFGHLVGSDPDSGYSCPDFIKVAEAYGIPAIRISNAQELDRRLDEVLDATGPIFCEINMPTDQDLGARVTTKKMPDGTLVAKPLEDMYPFLDRNEFRANMIVKTVHDD
jgi:acetolactate synthase-1/2/3 large subunit